MSGARVAGEIVDEVAFGHLFLRLRRMPCGGLFWALVHDAGSAEVGLASGPADAGLVDDLRAAVRAVLAQHVGAP